MQEFSLQNTRLTWTAYCGSIAVVSAVYFFSLSDLLLDMDDVRTFRDNVAVDADWTYFFSPNKEVGSGRLTVDLYRFLVYLLVGNQPGAVHLLLVGLHTATTLLLTRLLWRLGMPLALSFMSGLLFLVNVAHFRAVHWIGAQDYALTLALGCVTLLTYLRYREEERPLFLGLFYLCLLLDAMAHLAIFFVLPFFVYFLWRRGQPVEACLRHFAWPLALAPLMLYVVLHFTARATSTWGAIEIYASGNVVDLLLGSGRMLLWLPSRLWTTAHWVPLPLYESQAWELYVGAGVLVLLALAIWKRVEPVDLWGVWILLSLLPFALLTEETVVSQLAIMASPSRYLYMTTAGSSVLLAWGLMRLGEGAGHRFGVRSAYVQAGLLVPVLLSSYVYLKKVEAVSIYMSGRNYIAEGKFDLGIAQMWRGLDHAPEVLPLEKAYPRLCLALISRGDKFVRATEEGLTFLPNDARLNLYMYAYKSMAADSSSRRQAQHYLAKGKQYAAGKKNVDVSLSLGMAFNNLGRGFQVAQDFEQAVIAYRRSLEYLPSHTNSLIGLAYSLFALNRVEEAREVTRQVAQIEPRDPRVLYLMALSHQTEGKAAEALALSQEALRIESSVELYYLMSASYNQLGQFDLAATTLEEGVRRKGKNITPVTYERLGNYYRKSKRFDQALDAYRAVLDLAPAKLELYTQISSILRTHKGREAALQFYLEVLQKPELESNVYAQIGLLLNEVEARDDAIGALRQALERDARNADARTNLAWLLYLDGEVEQAIEQTRRVLDEHADSDAVFNLGLFYLHRGEVDKAREIYARAVRQFGAATAVEIGATDDLKTLIDRGIQVRAAGEILKAHWDL